MFDRVILLSEGYTIFNSKPSLVKDHFRQFGLKMSKFANPADKMSNIAAQPWSELREGITLADLVAAVRTPIPKYNK